MTRCMWKGAIQFGLVTLPIGLYRAVDPPTSPFHQHHRACSTRVQSRLWCPTCEKEVQRGVDITRGIEVGPDVHVTFTDAELDQLPETTPHAVEIRQFVSLVEATAFLRYSHGVYHVVPDPLGRRAYALLRDALASTRRIAIGTIAIRERERPAAIEADGLGLLLTTLAWPDEVRSTSELDLPGPVEQPARERRLAERLVVAMTDRYDPAALRDRRTEAIRAMVEAKVTGSDVVRAPVAAPGTALLDLMSALQASVEAARERKPNKGPATGRSRRAAA
jgi:DNA end-binding protein Ku